jgi:hypothetical protein
MIRKQGTRPSLMAGYGCHNVILDAGISIY